MSQLFGKLLPARHVAVVLTFHHIEVFRCVVSLQLESSFPSSRAAGISTSSRANALDKADVWA